MEREVEGSGADDVKLFQAGGWSQRRYQQRQVNTWEENAREVADEVARLAKGIDARLLAIGGDVYATGFRASPYADVKPPGDGTGTARGRGAPRRLWHSSPGSAGG